MIDSDPDDNRRVEPTVREQFARSPLLPVAVAITIGVLVDRYGTISQGAEFLIAIAGLVGWIFLRRRDPRLAKLGVLTCWASLFAAYHHHVRHFAASDDIGLLAAEPAGLARIRGTLVEEPIVRKLERDDPFVPTWKVDHAVAFVSVSHVLTANGWVEASGRIRMTVDRAVDPNHPSTLEDFRIGDELEATGFLYRPGGPSNPGERDYAEAARDLRLSAELRITKSSDAVVRIERGSSWSYAKTVASIRGQATRVIDSVLPEREAGLARALLLGDGTAMDRNEWDRFVRTGVVHALAISGQHLVVLAGFAWFLFRVSGVSRRRGAWIVMGLVIFYAVITGLRPSALRATVMVVVMCFSLIRRKPLNPANAFSLAWIAVVALDPVDLVNTGNLLSFLSVFVNN